jgi:transposase
VICPASDNSASCEIRAVIRFLHAKSMSATEIHRELCAVYGQNVMSEGTVRQWSRMFKDGRTNVYDEERSGRPFVVSDDLVQSVDQKTGERRRFTISELSCQFPQLSRTVLYEIIS